MTYENIMSFVILLICAVFFFAFSFWCFVSKNPVNFWVGDKVKDDMVTDIKKYNHSNGLMWLIYGFCWLLVSLVALFDLEICGFVTLINCLGIIILVLSYKKICRSYFKNFN